MDEAQQNIVIGMQEAEFSVCPTPFSKKSLVDLELKYSEVIVKSDDVDEESLHIKIEFQTEKSKTGLSDMC